MSIPLRVLLVEDQPTDAELLVFELRREGFEVIWERVETESAFVAALKESPNIVLADYNLPKFSAIRALKIITEQNLDIPLILVTGVIGEKDAISAIKQGAVDYVMKDHLVRLGEAVRSEEHTSELQSHSF